jgi:hypothetical protein
MKQELPPPPSLLWHSPRKRKGGGQLTARSLASQLSAGSKRPVCRGYRVFVKNPGREPEFRELLYRPLPPVGEVFEIFPISTPISNYTRRPVCPMSTTTEVRASSEPPLPQSSAEPIDD